MRQKLHFFGIIAIIKKNKREKGESKRTTEYGDKEKIGKKEK